MDKNSYTISEAEARRMRRGAFLPVLLIVPMAAMFGLDSSKSQPMHFLMTFAVATVIGGIVVSVSWYGANRRIAEFERTVLTVADGKLVWTKNSSTTETALRGVRKIAVQETRRSVRTITLIRDGGARTTLEGLDRMNELLEDLLRQTDAEVVRTRLWLGI